MTESRTFYGGDAPSAENVGGDRHYEGQTPSIGIWKCPACRTENEGLFEQGCVHCSAGKPGFHLGDPPLTISNIVGEPPSDLRLEPEPYQQARINPALPQPDIYSVAFAWTAAHEEATPVDAFVAGYRLALQQSAAHTMKAPPMTADVESFAPEGKPRRTIVAALRLFREVLTQAPDEIESGEWCSPAEVDALIAQLESE